MTPYAALQSLCGLSNREAAEYLAVAEDTVKSWRTGRRSVPDGALSDLLDLWGAIDTAAAEGADDIMKKIEQEGAMPAAIEIGYPADDHEAQALGLPCVGAWRQMAARLIDELSVMYDAADVIARIRFVPRGSTLPTAAAADAHGR